MTLIEQALVAKAATLHETADERYYVDRDGNRCDLSVTGVLEEAGFYRWFQRDPEAAERGTIVHKLLEYRDQNDLDWTTVDPELEGYVRAYEAARACLPSARVMYIEYAIADLGIGGRLDRLVIFDDAKPELWDIKTGEGAPDPVAMLQLSGYSALAGIAPLVGRRVIKLHANGTFHWDYRAPKDYRTDLKAWDAARTLACWKRAQ